MSDNWNDDETTAAGRVPDAKGEPAGQGPGPAAGDEAGAAEATRQFEAAAPDAGRPIAQHGAGAALAGPGQGGPFPGYQPPPQYAQPYPVAPGAPAKGAKVVNGRRYLVTQILAAVALLLIGGVGGLAIGHATAKPQFGNFRGGFGGGQGANGGQGFPGRGGAGAGEQAPGNRGGAGGSNGAPGSGTSGGASGSNSSFTLPATTVDPAAL